MSDITVRLRQGFFSPVATKAALVAADEIDRLRAHVSSLEAEWRSERDSHEHTLHLLSEARAELDALRKQEPVCMILDKGVKEWLVDTLTIPSGTKLYAAPVPTAAGAEVLCHHEAYQGRCIHCDIPISNGVPATPAPVAQKVPKDVAKGWKCHCCGFDGTENQPYNRFCVQCRRSR